MHKWIVALLAVSLTGCTAVLCGVEATQGETSVRLPNAQGRTATFRYLGAGGWMIRRGNDVVLTAPFYSNPSVLRVPFARPDKKVIDAELVHIERDLPDVRAVVAGHAHYDHIMDLPHILPRVPDAPLIGGRTVCHSLRAALHPARCKPELRTGNISITPIETEHAPHWYRVRLMRGTYGENDPAPVTAWQFREGEPHAYLIDFLGADNEVDLRVYYTDAGANPGKGIPSLDEPPIDVAILAVASFAYVKHQPGTIIEELQKPRHLLLGHWENFFSRNNAGCRVPLTNVNKYVREVKKTGVGYTLPDRRTVIHVEY